MGVRWLLLCLAAIVVATHALSERRTVMEAGLAERFQDSVISGFSEWTMRSKVPDDVSVRLIFALKQQNVHQLEALWTEIATPGSPRYGSFLTRTQLSSLLSPPKTVVNKIVHWIKSFGPEVKVEEHGEWLDVRCPVLLAETMVQASFYWFQHEVTETKFARVSGEYSLPSDIAIHVDFVSGLKRLPRVQRIRDPLNRPRPDLKSTSSSSSTTVKQTRSTVSRSNNSSPPGQWGAVVDPTFLRNLYHVNASGTNEKNSQSVVQFLEQYYSSYDLSEFFTLFWRRAYGRQPKVIGPDNFGAGAEASLDIEYIMSVGDGVPTTFWSNADSSSNQEPFVTWLMDVDKTENPPLVFSVSYGDSESNVSADYAKRTNIELMKQGVRGISVLFASGDSGVGGSGSKCKRFEPDFPAGSPYVTAVGGTYSTGLLMDGPESALYLSGGGFSMLFDRPAYQKSQVETYLATASDLPSPTLYNRTGRAYPDVSAQAWNYIIVVDLNPIPGVAGTSCAAPVWGGVIALLNDIRLSNGKKPLGPLNPLLYKMAQEHPSTFTDIQSGSNPGCNTNGFPATKGWDAATGLGTPVFSEMAKVILDY